MPAKWASGLAHEAVVDSWISDRIPSCCRSASWAGCMWTGNCVFFGPYGLPRALISRSTGAHIKWVRWLHGHAKEWWSTARARHVSSLMVAHEMAGVLDRGLEPADPALSLAHVMLTHSLTPHPPRDLKSRDEMRERQRERQRFEFGWPESRCGRASAGKAQRAVDLLTPTVSLYMYNMHINICRERYLTVNMIPLFRSSRHLLISGRKK